jgi:selT/selW/selH-like putative selenoprotein
MSADLVRGGGGIFDVDLDGKRVFSKHEEGDFPNEEDVIRRIESMR